MLKIAFNCNWCFFFVYFLIHVRSFSRCCFGNGIKLNVCHSTWNGFILPYWHPIPSHPRSIDGKRKKNTQNLICSSTNGKLMLSYSMANFDSAFTNLPFIYNVHMDLMVCGWCRYTLQKKSIDNLKQWYVQDQSPENKTYAERVTGIYVLWVEFESMPLFRSHFSVYVSNDTEGMMIIMLYITHSNMEAFAT